MIFTWDGPLCGTSKWSSFINTFFVCSGTLPCHQHIVLQLLQQWRLLCGNFKSPVFLGNLKSPVFLGDHLPFAILGNSVLKHEKKACCHHRGKPRFNPQMQSAHTTFLLAAQTQPEAVGCFPTQGGSSSRNDEQRWFPYKAVTWLYMVTPSSSSLPRAGNSQRRCSAFSGCPL